MRMHRHTYQFLTTLTFLSHFGRYYHSVLPLPSLFSPLQPSNDDGEILYHSPTDGLVSLAYNSRDQVGAYSVCPGDQVTFNIAIGEATAAL